MKLVDLAKQYIEEALHNGFVTLQSGIVKHLTTAELLRLTLAVAKGVDFDEGEKEVLLPEDLKEEREGDV